MTITLDFPEPCPECNPAGHPFGWPGCDICNGGGWVTKEVADELLDLGDLWEENEDDE